MTEAKRENEMTNKTRSIAKVCGTCFNDIRKDEYAPNTFNYGTCVLCGDDTFTYRITWAEFRTEHARREVANAAVWHPAIKIAAANFTVAKHAPGAYKGRFSAVMTCCN
jgi:NMD protein affecting ribosome stability and mRNA decay